jgi:hypothetical protein
MWDLTFVFATKCTAIEGNNFGLTGYTEVWTCSHDRIAKKKLLIASWAVMKLMVSPPPFARGYMWRSNLGLMAF